MTGVRADASGLSGVGDEPGGSQLKCRVLLQCDVASAPTVGFLYGKGATAKEVFAADVGHLGVGHRVEPTVGLGLVKLFNRVDHGGQHHRLAHGGIGPQRFGQLGIGSRFGSNPFQQRQREPEVDFIVGTLGAHVVRDDAVHGMAEFDFYLFQFLLHDGS